jgi:hypothetical protein
MARMALSDVLPNPLFHFIERARFRGPLRKQCAVNVLGSKPARAPDDDFVAVVVPLENRSGADSKFPPNICGNGNLSL